VNAGAPRQFWRPITRCIVDYDHLGARREGAIEAASNHGRRIISNDNDSDIQFVSLCPTTGEKKVQTPVGIETCYLLYVINVTFVFAEPIVEELFLNETGMTP